MAIIKKVGEFEVTGEDIIRDLKISLKLEPIARKVAAKHLIRAWAEQNDISVEDDELQKAADDFRRRHRLFKAADTNRFLDILGLTIEDIEWEFETLLLIKKTREKQFGDKAKDFFVEHKLDFEEIEIRHIVVRDEGTAEELLNQVQDDISAFGKIAKKYSLDVTTKRIGGYVGWVRKGTNLPEIEAKLFNGELGKIYGPFKVQSGFEIILLEDKIAPETMTDEIREEIIDHLFQTEFLHKHLPAEDF